MGGSIERFDAPAVDEVSTPIFDGEATGHLPPVVSENEPGDSTTHLRRLAPKACVRGGIDDHHVGAGGWGFGFEGFGGDHVDVGAWYGGLQGHEDGGTAVAPNDQDVHPGNSLV